MLFELILEHTVPVAAYFDHPFDVFVPLTYTFMDHLNQLVISIILLVAELLCHLLYDGREVMFGKRSEQVLPYGESQRLNDGHGIED